MKPFYWESEHGNFGDDLNLWLWDFLLPGFREIHDETMLVGVGTVLNTALLPPGIRKLVIGSGFGYGALPDMSDRSEWDIRCVRGPLTAEKVGIDPALGIIDPAVMVSEMPEFKNLPKIPGTTFIPHWESAVAGLWPSVCETAGVHYVDPRGEARSVIRRIAQSEIILAESMHAAILADAFRVPWVAVSTSHSINSFKWNDWARTVEVSYKPLHVPVSSRAEAILKGGRFWGFQFDGTATATGKRSARGLTGMSSKDHRGVRRNGLRDLAKRGLALPSAYALRRAGKAEPGLSRDGVLERRKEQLFDVIQEIRRDYF